MTCIWNFQGEVQYVAETCTTKQGCRMVLITHTHTLTTDTVKLDSNTKAQNKRNP